MPGILIYSDDTAVARQLITAGLELKKAMNQPVVLATVSTESPENFIAAGADKVFVLQGESTWPESYAVALGDIAAQEQASVILVGGTPRGKDIAAKVAAKLKAGLVTDALSVKYLNGQVVTTRMVYGGLALCEEEMALPAMATIPPGSFDEPFQSDGPGEVITIKAAVDNRISISDVRPIERQGVDLSAAARIVCVGRGLEKKEDLSMAEELARALGAEIGCSRVVAEDYQWLPVEQYIGISGQKVKPEIYLSLGVSGQVQHVAGIRDAKFIVAVDINENAPIFEAADYGIVGDMYKVVPLLIKALGK